jgi:hypothetical protein
MPRDITFTTFDGVKLAATVYTAGEKRPSIVMTQGVCHTYFSYSVQHGLLIDPSFQV